MKTLLLFLFALSLALPVAAQNERASGTIGSRDSVEVRVFREDDLEGPSALHHWPDGGWCNVELAHRPKWRGKVDRRAARGLEEDGAACK